MSEADVVGHGRGVAEDGEEAAHEDETLVALVVSRAEAEDRPRRRKCGNPPPDAPRAPRELAREAQGERHAAVEREDELHFIDVQAIATARKLEGRERGMARA